MRQARASWRVSLNECRVKRRFALLPHTSQLTFVRERGSVVCQTARVKRGTRLSPTTQTWLSELVMRGPRHKRVRAEPATASTTPRPGAVCALFAHAVTGPTRSYLSPLFNPIHQFLAADFRAAVVDDHLQPFFAFEYGRFPIMALRSKMFFKGSKDCSG